MTHQSSRSFHLTPERMIAGLVLALIAVILLTPARSTAQAKKLSAEELFRTDHLVEIRIELSKENWDRIRLQSRSFAMSLTKKENSSPFEYVKGDVTIDGVKIKNVGIRKKGFLGSLDEKRPSLKIKFSEYQKQDPVSGLDRLTLNNNKQDPGRLAQHFSYRIFNDAGVHAPRCNFAKVYVNGDYLGIYSNIESIKPAFLARGFSDGTGPLFEGTVTDFFPDFVERFERKNERADYQLIREITNLMAAEKVDLAALEKLLNVESFIRYWAVESLICYWDGYCNNQNNFFIYQNPKDSKFYFIPWGTDSIFVRTMPLPPYQIRPRSVHCQSILANRLYRIPEIQTRYQETLMEIMDKQFDEEKLYDEIDQLEVLLKEHVLDQRSFTRELRKYRSFVRSRRKDIMSEFEDGPPELPAREREPVYFAPIGNASLTFETKWYDKSPRNGTKIGDIEIELELHGGKVEFDEVGIYAEYSKLAGFGSTSKPPAIVVIGKRKSDGKRITLGTGLSAEKFVPGQKPVDIGGILIEAGRFTGPSGQMRMIGGEATFDKTSMKDGGTVKGRMTLTIVEMQGGKPVKDRE